MNSSRRTGYILGLVACICWGAIPLYFAELRGVGKFEILAHRIVWSVGLMLVIVGVTGGWKVLGAALRSRKTVLTMLLSSLLLALNWYLYIHATLTNRVTEAGLGYYMMPLVYAFLATIFLGEKLRPAHWPALAIIAIGVSIPFIAKRDFTWLALALPITFGFYGLVRKVAAVDSLTGLTIETFLLGGPSAIYLLWLGSDGRFGSSDRITVLLLLGGVVTVVPLLTYTLSIRRLPLLALNYIQFLSPTVQMLIGVYVFEEPMSPERWAAMICVWIAVAIFIIDATVASQAHKAPRSD